MNEFDIFFLVFGGIAAVYALNVWLANTRFKWGMYLLVSMGSGAIVGATPDDAWLIGLAAVALHGFAVGARCNDAGISKLHALWAWVPILFIGLAFFPSKPETRPVRRGSENVTADYYRHAQ